MYVSALSSAAFLLGLNRFSTVCYGTITLRYNFKTTIATGSYVLLNHMFLDFLSLYYSAPFRVKIMRTIRDCNLFEYK